MFALIQNGSVVVDDAGRLDYLLMQPGLFSDTGFKVLESQSRGFVPCWHVTHNGRDRLVYDVAERTSLWALLPTLTPGMYQRILAKLLDALDAVSGIGFIQRCHTDPRFDRVFVDRDTHEISIVNLPLSVRPGPEDEAVFEQTLRQNILAAMEHFPNVRGANEQVLLSVLQSPTAPLAALYEVLQPDNTGTGALMRLSGRMPEAPEPQQWQQGAINSPVQAPPPKKRLFGRRKTDANLGPHAGQPVAVEEGGVTEVLNIFAPSLVLVGDKTSVKVEVLINKPVFTLGKKAGDVDGVLDFNPAISRRHCRIITESGRTYLEDLGSANGTFLNDKKLVEGTRVECKPGDSIKLGNSRFVLRSI